MVLLVIALAAMAQAQERERGERPNRNRLPAAEKVTVSGSMIVHNGMPALKSGDDIYYVARLNRLIGFVDGLKEGAKVSIEGSVFSSPRDGKVKFLVPEKLSLAGKSYDFPQRDWNKGMMWGPNWPQMHQKPPQRPQPPRFPQRQHWL